LGIFWGGFGEDFTTNENSHLQVCGIPPGDTLKYTLNLAVSDYFAFGKDFFNEGQLIIRDQLSDGQTLTGTPTLTVTINGVTQTITLVTTVVTNADGTTSMAFDIAQSLRNAFSNIRGWLNGDLAFDDQLQGAVLAVLSYSAIVGQTYKPPSGNQRRRRAGQHRRGRRHPAARHLQPHRAKRNRRFDHHQRDPHQHRRHPAGGGQQRHATGQRRVAPRR
jgi:hypothetical protein